MKETREQFIARMKSHNFKKYKVKYRIDDIDCVYEEIRYAYDKEDLRLGLQDTFKNVKIISAKELDY